MAIGRTIWPVQGDPLRRNPSRSARPRPSEPGFERFLWYFMRLSGLALVHGVNGARIIVSDYIERGGLRSLLIVILLAITFVWLLIGIFVIVTFDPVGAPAIGPFS